MRQVLELLRREPRGRIFFAAFAQSSLGTGAGHVALLLVAYERFHSPWAISLVLVADLVPAMLLGPVFGAAADRWSRRWCLVLADAARALAWTGMALTGSFTATVALAVLAGAGTGLFTPAALAVLPGLVEPERLPAATSLYGALADLGFTAGPALAALVLLIGAPETVLAVNGASFAISAAALAALRFGAAPALAERRRSLLAQAREGLRASAGMPGVRVVLLASSGALLCAGVFNVAELLFARQELGAGDAGFSALVAMFGLGFVVGSLAGSRGGSLEALIRSYLGGLLLMGLSLVGCGASPSIAVALCAFAFAGFANGVLLVYERLLIQVSVPDTLLGRVFGIKDALTAWAFALAFVAGGALLSVVDVRPMVLTAGAFALAVWALAALALGRLGAGAFPAGAGGLGDLGLDRAAGQDRPHVVDGSERGLPLLDDAQ